MTMDRDPNLYNRETEIVDREPRGSNTLAYLIGGLVVALGLLAFLFYDRGGSDVSTTGSTAPIGQHNTPNTTTAPASPVQPMSPSAPSAPAAPAPAPAAPSSPAR